MSGWYRGGFEVREVLLVCAVALQWLVCSNIRVRFWTAVGSSLAYPTDSSELTSFAGWEVGQAGVLVGCLLIMC